MSHVFIICEISHVDTSQAKATHFTFATQAVVSDYTVYITKHAKIERIHTL